MNIFVAELYCTVWCLWVYDQSLDMVISCTSIFWFFLLKAHKFLSFWVIFLLGLFLALLLLSDIQLVWITCGFKYSETSGLLKLFIILYYIYLMAAPFCTLWRPTQVQSTAVIKTRSKSMNYFLQINKR